MTLKELIDYGIARDLPLDYPNSPPIEMLEEKDKTLSSNISNIATSVFHHMSRIIGLKYGGIISLQSTIYGDSFYYDDKSEMFYFRKDLKTTDVLTDGPFKLDYNWIPLVIRMENNKMFVYEGFPDISTGLLSVYNQITNSEIRIGRLRNKIQSLEDERLGVGEVIQGYFPLHEEYPNFIDFDSGLLSKTEYNKLYTVIKSKNASIQETETHFRILHIGGLVVTCIDTDREMLSVEEESQSSHAHRCTTKEGGIHMHDEFPLGVSVQNDIKGIPSDSVSGNVVFNYETPQLIGHKHSVITNAVGFSHFVCKNIALRIMIKYK